jgi:hypothetical protein
MTDTTPWKMRTRATTVAVYLKVDNLGSNIVLLRGGRIGAGLACVSE